MAFKLRHGNAANLMKGSPLYNTPVPKGMVDTKGLGNEDDFVVEGANQMSTETYPEASVKTGIKEKGTSTVKGAMYEGKGNLSKSTGQTQIVSQLTGGVVKDKANPNAKPNLSTDPKKVDVAIGGVHNRDYKGMSNEAGDTKHATPAGHSGKGYKTGKDSKGKVNMLNSLGGVPETISGKESNKGKSVDTKSKLVSENVPVKDQNTAMESGSRSDLALLGGGSKSKKPGAITGGYDPNMKIDLPKKRTTGVANTNAGDALKGHGLPSEGFEIKPFNPTIGGGDKSKGGGSSSRKKQNEGQIGGYLENAIKQGDITLGVDTKFDKTVKTATDPGHDVINQNSSYGGRVGRVKRRQERRTARVADRVDNRIGRMQGKQQIRDIRSTEQGKRDEKRESASQERKNLLTDNPVVKDATGGREGSQPGKTITNKRTAKGVKVKKEPKLRGRDKRTAKFTAELGNTINPNAAKATPRGAKTINPTTSTPKARTSREDRGKPEKPWAGGVSPSAKRLNVTTSGNKSTRTDNAWNPKNTGMPSSSSEVKGSNMTGSTSWSGASNYNKAASLAIDANRAMSGGSSTKPKSSKREGTFDYSQSSKTLKKRYK